MQPLLRLASRRPKRFYDWIRQVRRGGGYAVRPLLQRSIDHTRPVDDLRMIDYSVDNAVVGLEFVDASGGVDLRDLPFRQKAELLLGDSGLGLPLLV